MLQKMRDWLTPVRRKAIYNVCKALFALALVVGWVNPDLVAKFNDALLTVGGIVALVTNLIAADNVPDIEVVDL
jgi:hypothetical protein